MFNRVGLYIQFFFRHVAASCYVLVLGRENRRLTFNGYAIDWNNIGYFEIYCTRLKYRLMCLTESVMLSREQRDDW